MTIDHPILKEASALAGLTRTMLMVDSGIYDIVSDSLGYNVLGIFWTVQLQFLGYVAQRYFSIGNIDHPHTSLDDVVSQSHDERVCVVSTELLPILTQSFSELAQVTWEKQGEHIHVYIVQYQQTQHTHVRYQKTQRIFCKICCLTIVQPVTMPVLKNSYRAPLCKVSS